MSSASLASATTFRMMNSMTTLSNAGCLISLYSRARSQLFGTWNVARSIFSL